MLIRRCLPTGAKNRTTSCQRRRPKHQAWARTTRRRTTEAAASWARRRSMVSVCVCVHVIWPQFHRSPGADWETHAPRPASHIIIACLPRFRQRVFSRAARLEILLKGPPTSSLSTSVLTKVERMQQKSRFWLKEAICRRKLFVSSLDWSVAKVFKLIMHSTRISFLRLRVST